MDLGLDNCGWFYALIVRDLTGPEHAGREAEEAHRASGQHAHAEAGVLFGWAK